MDEERHEPIGRSVAEGMHGASGGVRESVE
jgi:hypothetical protein